VTPNHRVIVGALVLLAILSGVLLVVFAAANCPGTAAAGSCPDASFHRTVVISLGAISVALLATPFAFLAEVVARRRIVYRDAWSRAARRGLLAGGLLAALAALRLGGALSVPVALFLVVVAGFAEWFAARRLDVS
jgi:hypothetical protein